MKYDGSSSWNVLGTSQNQSHTFYQNNTLNELKVTVIRGSENAEDTYQVWVSDGGFGKRGADIAELPDDFELQQNYPNPFNPTTEIRFALPENGHVTLSIFNVVGQKIRTLVDEQRTAGYHSAIWDSKDESGNDVASGIYVYRIYVHPDKADSKSFESLNKMTLLR